MLSTKVGAEQAFDTLEVPQAAYIHIPFCRRRCYYCDFPISVVGDTLNGQNSGTIAHYIDVLCQEIQLTPAANRPLTTIFFGGGTPSLLSVAQLERILKTLDRQFGVAADAEISMEIDPGTFDLPQLQGYRSAGVNRVSLGVQTFQSHLLKACGRSQTVADVYAAVELIHQAEVQNYSLDLISGLPHQTLGDWQDSLAQAIALTPTHLSCYDLTIESVTAFGRQYKPGVTPLPSDETTAEMYRLAQKTLTQAGYAHYEISNYAKPGYQCRHNRVYWENRPFYGFGMGATSYVEGDRFSRPRKTREYEGWVKAKTENADKSLEDPTSRENAADFLLDTLMLGLRLAEGLSLERLRSLFGEETLAQVWQCLHPYYRQGWVQVIVDQQSVLGLKVTEQLPTGQLRFSDPEGFLFSNVMLVALFEAFE